MFYLFFVKYKTAFHKGSLKNISLMEYVFLLVLLVSSPIFLYQAFLGQQSKLFLYSLIIMVVDLIVAYIYEKRKERKLIDTRTGNYKSNVIEKLIEMLNDDKYNLYNLEGIDWLIACCDENIKPKQSFSIGSTILPVITLAYGVILKDMPYESVISTTMGLVLLILMASITVKYFMPYMRENVTNPDILLYKYLKSELEYIRIQYKSTQLKEAELGTEIVLTQNV